MHCVGTKCHYLYVLLQKRRHNQLYKILSVHLLLTLYLHVYVVLKGILICSFWACCVTSHVLMGFLSLYFTYLSLSFHVFLQNVRVPKNILNSDHWTFPIMFPYSICMSQHRQPKPWLGHVCSSKYGADMTLSLGKNILSSHFWTSPLMFSYSMYVSQGTF